jgi:para-aminobenzoate synthetase component 1
MVIEELNLRLSPLDVLERLAGLPRLVYLQGIAGPQGCTYSVFGWAPRASFEIGANDTSADAAAGDPLAALNHFLTRIPGCECGAPFPLHGGSIGYLAYDLRTAVERLPTQAYDDLGLPRAVLAWYDPLLVHEDAGGPRHHDAPERYYLVSSRHRSVAGAQGAGGSHRRTLAGRLRRHPSPPTPRAAALAGPLTSNMSPAQYHAAIGRIHDYIAAGDVYQINFAQRFSAPLSIDPLALFLRLARQHPMPLSGYLDAGAFQVLSNSPELFLQRRGGHVLTMPIKGTRRRGRDAGEDAALQSELAADPKERAEHVMIVDLERNDLGRICRPGSVRVPRCTRVVSYPTLHHLVSTVEGELRPGLSVGEIVRATFPGGSITGAPKIRAMEIIDGLEPHARGVYTGALGIIDGAGDMHLSLPIRTAVTVSGNVYYGAGGGIVADSHADTEYAESLLKAKAIFDALGAPEEDTVACAPKWCG